MRYRTGRRFHHVLCILTLFGVLSPLHADPQTPITFSGITDNQKIVIDYQTVAEVNAPGYTLEFHSTPAPLITVTYAGPYFRVYKNPHDIGSFALSQNQIVLLDHLLTYYRKHDKQGGCTTQHYVTLSLMEGDTVLRKESYVDETCNIEVVASATPLERKELKIADAPLISLDDILDSVLDKRPKIEPSKFPSAFASDANKSYADKAVEELRSREAEDHDFRQTLSDLHGFDELTKHFRLDGGVVGSVNGYADVLYVGFKTKQPRLIDKIDWTNPIEQNRTQYSAYQLLATYQKVATVAAPVRWLRNWKNASPGRSIELKVYGNQPNVLTAPYGDNGLAAWHDAGLRGKPYIEFDLWRADNGETGSYYGTVYLGSDDTRSLITEADASASGKNCYWLDQLRVSYTPGDKVPDYVVVARDGRWWRNQRPHPSPK